MATKGNKPVKKIDYSAPVKRSQLSIDYMMGYITEKAPDLKEEFKTFAISNISDDKLDMKAIRKKFEEKFPKAIIQRKGSGYKTAVDKLKEW